MYSVKTSHHYHRDKKTNKESGCEIVDGAGPKSREWEEGFVRWVVDLVRGSSLKRKLCFVKQKSRNPADATDRGADQAKIW